MHIHHVPPHNAQPTDAPKVQLESDREMDVVVDLETLDVVGYGRLPAILSIGAVRFDPSMLPDPTSIINESEVQKIKESIFLSTHSLFYCPISLASSIAKGFTISEGTVDWWRKQDYDMVAIANACPTPVDMALLMFTRWLKRTKVKRVWANAPTFDIRILRESCEHLGMELVIDFRAERDIRTAREQADIREETSKSPAYFIKHHALFDAAWEAGVVMAAEAKKRWIAEVSKTLNAVAQLPRGDMTSVAIPKDQLKD